MQPSITTPTHIESEEDVRTRMLRLPLPRPFYQSLNEFERHVLDSRQADMTRDQRMDYDPYA